MTDRGDNRRTGMVSCDVARDKLYPYALMALDNQDRQRVADHLAGCHACREGLEFTEARLQAIGAVQPTARARGLAHAGRRRWFRWLALLPALIAFGLLFSEGIKVARYRYEHRFIARLEKAVFQYRLQHDAFPPQDVSLARLLAAEGSLDLSRERVDQAGHFVDYWGNRYKYTQPGVHNKELFDISSAGQNGRDDAGQHDDLKNWDDDHQRLPIRR